MKKTIFIFFVIFLSGSIIAQTNMLIRKTDGTLISYPTNEIDSIYFETTPFSCGDQISDIDGNTYNTVEIGNQCWFQENLKVSHYSNGVEITLITDNSIWSNLGDNNTDKAYCWFNNDINNKPTHGALYTYAAATNGDNSGNDVQGACPDGWHLPNTTEWNTLIDFVGGWAHAGGAFKETGLTTWNSPNDGATNSSGLTVHGSGYRGDSGPFSGFGNYSILWSSSESSSTKGWYLRLDYSDDGAFIDDTYTKSRGFSIRCIAD